MQFTQAEKIMCLNKLLSYIIESRSVVIKYVLFLFFG